MHQMSATGAFFLVGVVEKGRIWLCCKLLGAKLPEAINVKICAPATKDEKKQMMSTLARQQEHTMKSLSLLVYVVTHMTIVHMLTNFTPLTFQDAPRK